MHPATIKPTKGCLPCRYQTEKWCNWYNLCWCRGRWHWMRKQQRGNLIKSITNGQWKLNVFIMKRNGTNAEADGTGWEMHPLWTATIGVLTSNWWNSWWKWATGMATGEENEPDYVNGFHSHHEIYNDGRVLSQMLHSDDGKDKKPKHVE